MTRRHQLRTMFLFSIGMALGKLDALKADGGELTVPLDQWQRVVFKYRGKKVVIPVSEIFTILSSTSVSHTELDK